MALFRVGELVVSTCPLRRMACDESLRVCPGCLATRVPARRKTYVFRYGGVILLWDRLSAGRVSAVTEEK
jgi:hypothetical protein